MIQNFQQTIQQKNIALQQMQYRLTQLIYQQKHQAKPNTQQTTSGKYKGSFLDKTLHVIETLGKWSMLDVFVVALLLVSVKLGVLAKVEVHYGLYVFATSVLLTMGLSFWIYDLAEKRE